MELMVKAMKAKVGNPLRKLVLIKLADNANDQGECWPSYQHIADQCEIGRSTVKSHIRELEKMGFLVRIFRRDGELNKSNIYRLNLDAKGGAGADRVGQELPEGGAGAAPGGGAGAAPRTSHSFEPVSEPVKEGGDVHADQDDLFNRFWNLYPRKIRKADARKAWAKLKVTDHLFGQIIDGLARYCASAEWLKDGGRFVPHAPTWLNGSRWEDEVGEAAEAGAPADSEAPVDQIIDLYHRACPNLAPVSVKTDKTLRAMIEERWSESPEHQSGDDFWVPFFLKANNRNQVFYRGQNIAPRLEALVSRAVFREIAEAQQ